MTTTTTVAAPTHYDLCIDVTRWAVHQGWCDFAAPEVSLGNAVCDVLTCGHAPLSVRIIEVKRTRSDLLSDLRREKMQRRYERYASHNYLALGPDLFDSTVRAVVAERTVLDELAVLGLPAWWGVLRLHPGDARGAWSIRRARKSATELTRDRVDRTIRAIGRSATWRLIRDHQGRR